MPPRRRSYTSTWEGQFRRGTLLKLVARNGVRLPAATEASLRRLFTYRDSDHFVEIYVTEDGFALG